MRSLPWKKIVGAAGLGLLAGAHLIPDQRLRLAAEAVGGLLAYYGDHAAEPKEPKTPPGPAPEA